MNTQASRDFPNSSQPVNAVRESIAVRAYAHWAGRGCPPGTGLEDWLQAEWESLSEIQTREESLRLAMQAASLGTWEWEPARDALRWSTTLAEIHGLAPEAAPKTLAAYFELIHPDDRDLVRQAYTATLETGTKNRLEYRIVWPDGSIHWVEGRGLMHWDANGKPARLVGVRMDITPRKQTQQRQAVERDVAFILAKSTTLAAATPRIIASLCVCLGWDIGTVWEVDNAAQLLRCVEVWHAPAVYVPEFAANTRQRTFSSGVGLPGRVWASGRPAWIPDVTRDNNFPRAPTAAREGLYGAVAFPICCGGEVLGVIEFFSQSVQPLDEDLLAMMGSIGAQISQFIERQHAERNSAQRDHELHLARQVQQGLYPQIGPTLSGFQMAGAVRPAREVGGDYFDFIPCAGRLGLVIGDVCGHGLGPALLMMETRAYVRALAHALADAGEVLTRVNRFLVEDCSHRFVTLFLACLNPVSRTLDYCSAGHCPGYVLDQTGAVRTTLPSSEIPLGVSVNTNYKTAPAVPLQLGDLLFLYTDGIPEAAAAGRQFGLPRALQVLRDNLENTAEQIVAALLNAVEKWSPDAEDDVTVVIVKVESER